MSQLTQQGSEAFVRYGIAQMTRGGISEEVAQEMLERFPDMEMAAAVVQALGCTDEGFEEIVAEFPDAQTAICLEACTSSPAFADALRRFCGDLDR